MDCLEVVHDSVDDIKRSVHVSLDSHACAVFDSLCKVFIFGLAKGFHPYLEFIEVVFIGICRDRNTGDVLGVFVFPRQSLVHFRLSFRLVGEVKELTQLLERNSE